MVSVVIPTYNQPALLLQTIASVLAQSYTDYEIVVVDDGSTDDTRSQLLEMAAHERRLRVVTQANGGTGAARNRGITEARGRYVALLDHDDLWSPHKLATEVAFMEGRPGCVACIAPLTISSRPGVPSFDAGIASPDGLIERPARKAADGALLFLTCSAVMIRRAAAQGARFAETRGATEDIPFYIGLIGLGRIGVSSREIQGTYRVHPGNASQQSHYHERGVALLREMFKQGRFSGLSAQDWRDCQYWLAAVARSTLMAMLLDGRRLSAWWRYLLEARYQLMEKRFKFLLIFPLLSATPTSRLRRRFGPNT